MKDQFIRIFDYTYWANSRVMEHLEQIYPIHTPSHRLLAHILSSERIWIARILGEDYSAMPIWVDDSTTSECREWLERNRNLYSTYLSSISQEDLLTKMDYRDSQGVTHSTTVADILTHVSHHGSYHRAQIAANLRREGIDPVSTDYILFVREL